MPFIFIWRATWKMSASGLDAVVAGPLIDGRLQIKNLKEKHAVAAKQAHNFALNVGEGSSLDSVETRV